MSIAKWIMAASLIGASGAATAQVTYHYSGSKFDSVSGLYTTSDSVQGSFTVPSALPANLQQGVVIPSSYAFSDGVQTIIPGGEFGFSISTDANGQISAWNIQVFLPSNGGIGINSPNIDLGVPDQPSIYDQVETSDEKSVASSDQAGVWTGPIPTLVALRLDVTGVGPGKSLANKVDLAQVYYAAKDIQATCAMLTAFVNEVEAQDGKKIVQALDALLIAEAQAVEAAIGCTVP